MAQANQIHRSLTIINKLGLHARAATKLVQLANQFDAEIMLTQGENSAPANSVLALMMLESGQGKTVDVHCSGDDATAAMDAITELIQNKFDESE
ncbi:HPr family phosphocarrier protein [Glaciecola sp. XM2]|jgi:phosphocarrier protein NPr|uniref:HPr family phosphocarrier protein n=1 Tax=Glaciecola sp. XM2 TaxID=1914931 RepID=UPI001BDDEFD5|nr:HPr family phosphocarrier protein [Glaciecola sp. XM2]MBT1452490.1 HPr family phosphocarrier protein [Glaciecola sp. XM2]